MKSSNRVSWVKETKAIYWLIEEYLITCLPQKLRWELEQQHL